MSGPNWFTCGYCHASAFGGPPHNTDPCPMKVREHEAYVAMLEAQRASHQGAGFAVADMGEAMRRMMGDDDE